jgi:hypothetical protein
MPSITITRSVRGRLAAITRDRNASQKHAWRAAIILSSADGVGTNEIMRRSRPRARGLARRDARCFDHVTLTRGAAALAVATSTVAVLFRPKQARRIADPGAPTVRGIGASEQPRLFG